MPKIFHVMNKEISKTFLAIILNGSTVSIYDICRLVQSNLKIERRVWNQNIRLQKKGRCGGGGGTFLVEFWKVSNDTPELCMKQRCDIVSLTLFSRTHNLSTSIFSLQYQYENKSFLERIKQLVIHSTCKIFPNSQRL